MDDDFRILLRTKSASRNRSSHGDAYDRPLNRVDAAAGNGSRLVLVSFRLAGDIRSLTAGRCSAVVARAVNRRALCRSLRRAPGDVDGPPGDDGHHRVVFAGQNGKWTVARFCGAT